MKKAKVIPLYDKVLVKRDEELTVTDGGIFIPDTAQDKPAQGTVMAVGQGVKNIDGNVVKLFVKPGQKVLFGKYAGTEVNINNEVLFLMREDEILAVVEG